jgi:hypothetical protein
MTTPPIPPNQAPKPQLEDPLNEREIFATEIVGIGSVHGNIAITLATVRFDEPVGSVQPKARRVVTGRLVLTSAAAGQLLQSLQRLFAQIEAAQIPAAKAPN